MASFISRIVLRHKQPRKRNFRNSVVVVSVRNVYQTTLKVCLVNSHRDGGTSVSANTLTGRALRSEDDEDIVTIELQGKAALWWTAAGTEKKTL